MENTRFIHKQLEEIPKNLSLDWPILQLHVKPEKDIETLFAQFSVFPQKLQDDDGKTLAILFQNQASDRWFYAHDTDPISGLIIEVDANTNQDMLDAYNEVLELLKLSGKDIAWVSEYVQSAQQEPENVQPLPH